MLDRKRRVKTTISPPLTFNLKVDFTFSVPSKEGEAVCLLAEKLIDRELQDIGKELQDFDKVLQDIQKIFRGLSRGGQTGPPHFRGS